MRCVVVPEKVRGRARSMGQKGLQWLDSLDLTIATLEKRWQIQVGETLEGGTEAFVARATQGSQSFILKIALVDSHFQDAITLLQLANGQGLVRLYAYDDELKAYLLEELGLPLDRTTLPLSDKLRMILTALEQVWRLPCPTEHAFVTGEVSVRWFRAYLLDMWAKLAYPCPFQVIAYAWQLLDQREQALDPSAWVLLHGDAHGMNALLTADRKACRLVDPEGLFYEKAYDLGILMREWIEDYLPDPCGQRQWRARYLHQLSGVDEKSILAWGYLQTVSTAFVFYQIGQKEKGERMLSFASLWSGAKEDMRDALAKTLWQAYDLQVIDLQPAQRGFYGETWLARTPMQTYFVKVDPWSYHQASFQNSLAVIQYLRKQGIAFIPDVILNRQGGSATVWQGRVLAVFEYIPGTHLDDCSALQLYLYMKKIYDCPPPLEIIKKETFSAEKVTIFSRLAKHPDLPDNVKEALQSRWADLQTYGSRLKALGRLCQKDLSGFVITHGDAGGNCLMNDEKLFIVDWDTVMLAPVERDTWIYMHDRSSLVEMIEQLALFGGADPTRLCYYCYDFFFHYLNEYLKNIIASTDPQRVQRISAELVDYLTENWIDARLAAADQYPLL